MMTDAAVSKSIQQAITILSASHADHSLLSRYRQLRQLAAEDVWMQSALGVKGKVQALLRQWVLPPVSDFNQGLLGSLRLQLLAEAGRGRGSEERPRILYVAPFDVLSMNGGAARVLGLAKALARSADVCILSVVGPARSLELIPVAPGVTIYAVPQSLEFVRAIDRDRPALGGAAFSLGLDRHMDTLPLLNYWFKELGATATTCILNQPYLINLWQRHPAAMRLFYDVPEVNSFFTLRNARNAQDPDAVKRLQAELERAACQAAEKIGMCSAVDIDALVQEQGDAIRDKIVLAPNGIDVDAVPFFPPDQAKELREACGQTRPIAVFLGSPGYPPNLEAVQFMAESLAPTFPGVDFVVIGMTLAQAGVIHPPANFICRGRVSEAEKIAILCMADVALSPIRSYDSGSSLKIAEYVAHGKPVLATEVGMRGYEALHTYCSPVHLDMLGKQFELILNSPSDCVKSCTAARLKLKEMYDWAVIASQYEN